MKSSPPGREFLGSADFPPPLMEAVDEYDPAMMFCRFVKDGDYVTYNRGLTQDDEVELLPLMKKTLYGRRILNMAGADDKLVPYKCSEPFLQFLKRATGPEGFFAEGNVVVKDIVFEGVGHEMSPPMIEEAHRFVIETLELRQSTSEVFWRGSKI